MWFVEFIYNVDDFPVVKSIICFYYRNVCDEKLQNYNNRKKLQQNQRQKTHSTKNNENQQYSITA